MNKNINSYLLLVLTIFFTVHDLLGAERALKKQGADSAVPSKVAMPHPDSRDPQVAGGGHAMASAAQIILKVLDHTKKKKKSVVFSDTLDVFEISIPEISAEDSETLTPVESSSDFKISHVEILMQYKNDLDFFRTEACKDNLGWLQEQMKRHLERLRRLLHPTSFCVWNPKDPPIVLIEQLNRTYDFCGYLEAMITYAQTEQTKQTEAQKPFPVEPSQQKSFFPLSDSQTSQRAESSSKFSETLSSRGPTNPYQRLSKILSSSSSGPASPPRLVSPPAPLSPKDGLAGRRPRIDTFAAKWTPSSPHCVRAAKIPFSRTKNYLPAIGQSLMAQTRFTSLSKERNG